MTQSGSMLAQDARDADAVGHVDVGVGETNGVVAEGAHEILTELTRGADDQRPHAGTPAMIVSFSQRMLKKRGSLSGSSPKSPRSSASQMATTASVAPRSGAKAESAAGSSRR